MCQITLLEDPKKTRRRRPVGTSSTTWVSKIQKKSNPEERKTIVSYIPKTKRWWVPLFGELAMDTVSSGGDQSE